MSPQPQYGSIKDSDEDLDVELLATTHVGDVDATGSDDDRGGGSTSSSWSGSSSRHRRVSYALLTALAVCLFSARYWHDNRAAAGVGGGGSRDDDGGRSSSSGGGGGGIGGGRVPVTPALSALDPSSDLGFRVATRTGDALPSSAWGAHREKKSFSSGGSSSFAPLPTNQWYLVSSSPEGAYISRGGGARRSAAGRIGDAHRGVDLFLSFFASSFYFARSFLTTNIILCREKHSPALSSLLSPPPQ